LHYCKLAGYPLRYIVAVQTLVNAKGKNNINTGLPAKLSEPTLFLSLSKRLNDGAFCPIEMVIFAKLNFYYKNEKKLQLYFNKVAFFI